MVGGMNTAQLAEQIYTALVKTLKESRGGLLVAAGDVREGVVFQSASPKTRAIFYALAENLTRALDKG